MIILANLHALFLFVGSPLLLLVAFALSACAGSSPAVTAQDVAPVALPLRSAELVAGGVLSVPGVAEVRARRELDSMFRAAGFRILNDELVKRQQAEVVLDGYDPEREVGYEYIDSSEVAVNPGEREGESFSRGGRILLVRNCSIESLRRQARAFLARIEH